MAREGMTARFAPRSMRDRKAPHGKPCTSCGLCCHVALCDVAARVFEQPRNAPGPCPALEWVDGNSRCGMLVDPIQYSVRAYAVGRDVAVKAAAVLIAPGDGCDMSMSMLGDRDEGYAAGRAAADRQNVSALRWALRVWGMPIPPMMRLAKGEMDK